MRHLPPFASDSPQAEDATERSSLEWDLKFERVLRVITIVSAVTVGGVMVVLGLIFVNTNGPKYWNPTIAQHFAATIGLTAAIIVSFGVVVFLRQTEGSLEFEAVGIKVRGAAGQVILWCLCVIVLSACAKLLW